ncbi:MAG: 16S rRNA (uracil(1498)-N(3))-methyltransferase [Polyangiaceae bacterium]|nr:16S rRNA (uracil(1498)-N(3))-methyltransferase [Polyangiaceae bacterium]
MTRAVRVAESSLEPGERTLSEAASRYLVRVHRLAPGRAFSLFDPEARLEAEATLTVAHPRRARCRIDAVRAAPTPSGRRTTLVQALGKGDKPDQVLRDATQLGVSRVVFALTERSVVSLGERAASRATRWRQIALDAARQSGRPDVPELGPFAALGEVLAEVDAPLCLLLHPAGGQPLLAALSGAPADAGLVLLIGPEGGFSDAERGLAREHGFSPVTLGRLVLRTETAAVAALGAVLAADEARGESGATLVRSLPHA